MALGSSKRNALLQQNLYVCAALGAGAQTISFSAGVQKYGSLTNTTVSMSGLCELWVTNSLSPLSGCTINLNSADAWLFLPSVKPSTVASAYLGQVKVSGAAAVADNNVRVAQYGQAGAIVIPQSPSFQPLTVFGEAEFGGASARYSQWTYYTGAGIGKFSSFKLKRGGTFLGTNWFDVRGSTGTNSLTLPVDPRDGSVFYRLTYP